MDEVLQCHTDKTRVRSRISLKTKLSVLSLLLKSTFKYNIPTLVRTAFEMKLNLKIVSSTLQLNRTILKSFSRIPKQCTFV